MTVTRKPNSRGPIRRRLAASEARLGLALALPAMVALALVIAYPFLQGIQWSLTDLYLLRGLDNWNWVGLQNYLQTLSDPKTLHHLRGTAIWVVGSLVLQLGLGLTFALLLHRRFRYRPIYRALILIPWVTPPAVTALIWRWILHADWGVVNNLLASLGLVTRPIQWLGDPVLVWISLLVVGMWRHFPFWYVNLLAGLQMIPGELYEQAQIDGASRLQSFRYVTLPYLRPIITVLLLLETIWRANEFALIWTFTEGGPAGQTTTLAIATYMTSFQFHRIGLGSSIGVLLALALTVVTIFYVRAIDTEKTER